MDEIFNQIIQQISNNLDRINTDIFLNNIKNAKEIKECYELSNHFTDTIIDSKTKILLYLSEEKEKLVNKQKNLNDNNNIDLNKLMNNLKSNINQSKLKLKNLQSNVNDLNSNLNLINGNLEKKKYSLATSRVEKLFQLKNTMSTNIKSLESLQLNILQEIKSEKLTGKKSFSSTFTKIRPNRTPSPFTPTRENTKNRFTINSKNNLYEKRVKTKRDLSLSIKSLTAYNMPFPSAPEGWYNRKSSSENPLFFNKHTAIASPIASVAVVLAVGALPKGHASFSTEISK